MSLGGLAVAIGLIIDDTVVVIENIARHLAEGQTGDLAVDRASREISGAVIGSTLTTILVFVPLAFVRGVVGQFFQSLAISLTVALVVSMVVSLTIIPVLAARFLGRRPMPTTGPIYNRLADVYERALKVGLRFPKTVMLLALLAVVPGWILLHGLTIPIGKHSIEIHALETGFMPDMDEGAFVLDYNMPVGTSLAQTDKVMRRVEDVLLRTPDIAGYIRRTGAELGFFATEPYTGDILVSLKPPGQRRPASELFDALRDQLKAEVPELETEFVPLVQDQINDLAGVDSPIEVKVFGPDFATLRTLAEQVGKVVEEVPGRRRRQRARLSRQSRHRRPARQRPDRPRRPDRDGRRVSAQRGALRPGCEHGPGTGPHDEDSRSLPGSGPVRPRQSGPAANQPGDGHPRAAAARASRRPPGLASSRLANWRRSVRFAVPTSCGAKTSSPLSP